MIPPLLTNKEIIKAVDKAFDEVTYLDRAPTQDDLKLIEFRAVAQAQLEADIKYYGSKVNMEEL